MKAYKSVHGVYKLQYHIVWVCKYCRKVLNLGVSPYIERVLAKLLRSMPGVLLESVGFDEGHVHMLMVIPPKYSVSGVMRDLKSRSTAYLRKKFSWLSRVYWKENIFWSPGFFVSSVGVDEEVIRRYVEYQGQEDSGQIELDL
ncbi:IS200/IS605 family transposase [Piscirickettsia litoralis]|uniref:Transposase IS200-like domain-containing protein n=1 Tax=Piscirickettsia litoralis TaxID=1891921 RepID=A0ABX3A159_9GAMM|nr:IS200/IS605 family transposase [Piscirickettsia litoralis]ODN42553.1 hypothetical protein BGC07_05940 [Piscirickettsia litoralis]